jgi:hypothetical protein
MINVVIVTFLKYLKGETTATYRNCIHQEIRADKIRRILATIKFRILFLFRLLFENVKIKMYEIISLPVVLYGCTTWSLKLKNTDRMKMAVFWVVSEVLAASIIRAIALMMEAAIFILTAVRTSNPTKVV